MVSTSTAALDTEQSSTTPPTAPRRRSHQPALDGVRGLAVAGVLMFHAGFSWARGGFLGVSTFFTLSGFLITTLLLDEHGASGRIDLPRFWARRVRRLAPALLLCLAAVALFAATVADEDQLLRLRADAFATLAYVANWRFIWSGQTYSDLFAAPSPLLHMWSLAIEEQLYVLFPLAVGVVLRLRGRRALAWLFVAASVASVALTALLHDGGDTSRAYYGTDTRAVELLVGALLAVWFASRGRVVASADGGRLVAGLGVVALMATLAFWALVDQGDALLYHGGLASYALVSVALLVAALHEGPANRMLSWRPLRALGLISYGVYLYHWPIYLWLSPGRTGLSPWPLLALRLAVTLVAAVVSYRVLEQPIRSGAVPGRVLWLAAPTAAVAVAVALVSTTVPPDAPGVLAAGTGPTTATTVGPALSGDHAAVAPRPPAVVRDATSDDPLRVLILGDSVLYDALPGMTAALEATGEVAVTPFGALGFGLTAGGLDWRRVWAELRDRSRAEVVVLMYGGWDEGFITEHGDAAYAALVDEAVGLFAATARRVVVLGMPPAVDREGNARPRAANRVFVALPARWPGLVEHIDLDPVLAPGGAYASHLVGPGGERERARKLDGIHLCPAGAAAIARVVLEHLTPAWGLAPPDPAWRAGAWALDPRYDSPRGACPP